MLEQYLFESCELEVHKKCIKIGTEHTQKFPTAQLIDENKVPSFTIRIQPSKFPLQDDLLSILINLR